MGSDPTPFMANLFLCYFLKKWILKLNKSNLKNASSFAFTFHFIDELGRINGNSLHEKKFQKVYPNN